VPRNTEGTRVNEVLCGASSSFHAADALRMFATGPRIGIGDTGATRGRRDCVTNSPAWNTAARGQAARC
jgi:hypothetical protein